MIDFIGEGLAGEAGAKWSYDPDSQVGDSGGFAKVFCGTGPGGRAVAVKRVPLRHGDEGERRLREREVEISRLLANVPAEHLMRMLDIGRVNEDLLLVMPLARCSLATAIRDGLDETEQLDALRQVAQGLVELAQPSVLHRDLKPGNVLEVDGCWQLADFGISRDLAQAPATYTFSGYGTLPYMAPELWNNQPATAKSDLYAYGVLAYEVLTGTRPFPGPDGDAFRRQHLEDPPPPLPDTVRAAVRRLVFQLLEKEPTKRPQDARAVLERLDAASKPLPPQLLTLLQEAVNQEQKERSAEAANAAQAAEQAKRAAQLAQAISDLDDILGRAVDWAREALPDLEFSRPGQTGRLWKWIKREIPLLQTNIWKLTLAGRFQVTVMLWKNTTAWSPNSEDPLLLAGSVLTDPEGRDVSTPAANVVCEVLDGRQRWSLVRFMAADGPTTYEFGPTDRPHGFKRLTFNQQRSNMIHPGKHGWAPQQTPLNPETVIELLREAINHP